MFVGRLIAVGVAISLCASASTSSQQIKYVVLPWRSVPTIPSRVMGDVERHGSWQPEQTDIDGLEKGLSHISGLNVMGWKSNIHIEHPEQYFRQYVGVSRKGNRQIYINAFCDDPPPTDWRSHLLVVDDGATCYWQALYDPATKTFSNLTINARA
jgi:hypothetical protein